MNIIEQLEAEETARINELRELPPFEAGDTVRVNVRVTEGTRTRVQAFEGVCIARSGGGIHENFTVRKISYGEGVERVFPVYSPQVEGVEVRRVEGLARRDRSMASALYNLILVDAEYHPDSKDPKTDFIVGHEMSHVKWNDSSATLAQDALEEAVESVFRGSGSNTERQQLAELANDLQQAQLADSRRMENRADQ